MKANRPDNVRESELLSLLEDEYMSKILGFAYLKTNSREEAEDLTQEICLQVIEAVRKGRPIENIGAYIWTVSNNVLCKKIKHRTMRSCLELSELLKADDDVEEAYIKEETENSLRRMVSILSHEYRDVVIMYYFDSMSVAEIAARMHKSEGTVKWWLSEARKMIKDGMIHMKEYGERSFRPDVLTMSCQYDFGDNREPMSCAKRKSAQNILIAAYDKPMSVEELSLELGISAPYIEDEVEFLTENQLMKQTASGKYQTDFVILRRGSGDVVMKNYKECFPEYSEKLLAFLESKRSILESDEFNIGKFTWERLLWTYIPMVSTACEFKFKSEEGNILTWKDIPDRPNNGHWIAIGYENSGRVRNTATNTDPELRYFRGDGLCMHPNAEDGHNEEAYFHVWNGQRSQCFFDLREDTLILCKDIITGKVKIEDFDDDQKLIFTNAIENKLFIKDGDSYRQNYFFIYQDKYREIMEMAQEFYDSVVHLYRIAYKNVMDAFKDDVPKHLHWQMVNLLMNNMIFVQCVLYDADIKGVLSPFKVEGKWLSMFQTN